MNTQKEMKFKNKLLRETIISDRQSRKALEESIKNGFRKTEHKNKNETMLVDEEDCNLLSTIVLAPPFEAPLGLTKSNATLWQEDRPAPEYRLVAEAMADTGELNVASVAGVSFSTDYNDPLGNPTTMIETLSCAPMICDIPLTPNNRDTVATISTVMSAPGDNNSVYYLDRGNADIEFAGVQAELYTSVSYINVQGEHIINASRNFFLHCLDSKNTGLTEFYNPFSLQHCSLFIPAGTSTIRYYTRLIAKAFVSTDILELTSQAQADKYAIALIDFRHKQKHQNLDIFIDPIQRAWNKKPGGSVIIFPRLNICEATAFSKRENLVSATGNLSALKRKAAVSNGAAMSHA